MTVLFVCTGNTCRSPMAEGLMRDLLHRRGVSACVLSAGLAADGQPAATNAVAAMEEVGLDISRHRSRQLTREMIEAADVLAVMTDSQARALQSVGIPADKIRVLGEGIPDPFGGDMAVYRQTRDALQAAASALADDLFGAAS